MAPQQLTLNLGDLRPADLAAAEDGPGPSWAEQCRAAIELAARSGRTFQAADLVTWYELPEPRHPNQWGAAFTAASHEHLIERVGAAPSKRKKTARSLVYTWRGRTNMNQAA